MFAWDGVSLGMREWRGEGGRDAGTHHATFFSASDALTITTWPLSICPVRDRHAGMSVCSAISM